MNSFSFNRFGKTLRWVWSMNFRSLMMWTTGFSLVIFFAEMMIWYLNKGVTTQNIVGIILLFITIFFMIGVGASISSMFLEINKKPRRKAFLMLPASNLEKFLSVVLYFTIAWTVCIFLSIAVGDTLRMVFRSLVSGDEWISCLPRFVDSFAPSFLYRSIYDYTLSYKVMQVVVLTGMILFTTRWRCSMRYGLAITMYHRKSARWGMCLQWYCPCWLSSTTGHRSISSKVFS